MAFILYVVSFYELELPFPVFCQQKTGKLLSFTKVICCGFPFSNLYLNILKDLVKNMNCQQKKEAVHLFDYLTIYYFHKVFKKKMICLLMTSLNLSNPENLRFLCCVIFHDYEHIFFFNFDCKQRTRNDVLFVFY